MRKIIHRILMMTKRSNHVGREIILKRKNRNNSHYSMIYDYLRFDIVPDVPIHSQESGGTHQFQVGIG